MKTSLFKQIATEDYIGIPGPGVSCIARPGDSRRGRFAVSYMKFYNWMQNFHERGAKLKWPKPEPYMNMIGAVKFGKSVADIVQQELAIYVWDTKKIITTIPVPKEWYLEFKDDPEDLQDFISIFVTRLANPFIVVPDPIDGPNLKV